MTALSIIPIAVLNSYSTLMVSGGSFNQFYSCSQQILPSGFIHLFYPKTNIGFGAGGIILAGSAALSGIFIILDNVSDTFLEPIKYPLISLSAWQLH